jgi:hypothetical protein
VIEKQSNLKMKYDDLCIELKHISERLNDKQLTNTDLDNRTKYINAEMMNQINIIRNDNYKKEETIQKYLKLNRDLEDKLTEIKNNIN